MVRVSSKVSPRRNQPKEKSSPTQPIELNPSPNPIDQSSSKILHVVRQALLNAAEELVSQQKQASSSENQLHNSIPIHTLDISDHSFNRARQRNENAIKKTKKKVARKTPKNIKHYTRRK